MASRWSKAKVALGLNLCVYVPRSHDEASPSVDVAARFSDVSLASAAAGNSHSRPAMPTTPTPSSSGLRLAKTGSRSSKRTCAICLGSMKPGNGHALFTAECSHTFHFHCIASNVKHGNQICPVCRAKWKEIPFQGPSSDLNHGRARINPVDWAQDDNFMTVLRRLPPPRVDTNRQIASSLFHTSEPSSFSDDEPLDPQPQKPEKSSPAMEVDNSRTRTVEIKMYPEFSAVPRSASHENFAVLIHLKAPFTAPRQNSGATQSNVAVARQTSRAPVDLVTVLDVSGSMAGTKLALLKRAMGFVIQNLGPSDRLSVIAFSSTARRLFHLRRMSDSGRQQALQAVNSLTSSGGTNIAEGLRKGAKVMEDRREKNPVCSIILLSDGQDTYTVSGSGAANIRPDYQSLLPSSIRGGAGCQIPVHAFGFGMDHDAASMHSISETSGGTFSFIEAEGVIQDAFAQCIGGLLSVVVQELHVAVESVHPRAPISLIKAGNYTSCISSDGRTGSIDVGDLYADEERDFLVSVNVPASNAGEVGTTLVKVGCAYRDPVSNSAAAVLGKVLIYFILALLKSERASQLRLKTSLQSLEILPPSISPPKKSQENRRCDARKIEDLREAFESRHLSYSLFLTGEPFIIIIIIIIVMAWEVLLWLFSFLATIILLALAIYQLICLSDLEFDYINPYDSSSRINSVVMPEFLTQGTLCAMYLLTGHWFVFLITAPITYYHVRLYMQRKHLIDVTEIFSLLNGEKKLRMIKIGFYLVLFFIVLYRLVATAVMSLIDDDDSLESRMF